MMSASCDLNGTPLPDLLDRAFALKCAGHGTTVSYSRKVFIPLTQLCRDVCGYCTFAKSPRQVDKPYLLPDDIRAIAHAGKMAGCKEALFTLGDKPELRYTAAKDALAELGCSSTIDYLVSACRMVLTETGLLPHVNAGVMEESEIVRLREVSASQGIMLENVSARLMERGGPHFGCPDKDPVVRMAMIAAAGRQRVPFTSGILIGIGETWQERVQSLLALRSLHEEYGHLQEIIIQNFRSKATTRMAAAREPDLDDLLRTVAAARIIFGPSMNIQVPPNLSYADYPELLAAGINDWGGISPVTIDHVNPEAPWPAFERLARATEQAGQTLVERLAVYPSFAIESARWQEPNMIAPVLSMIDADGFARTDTWSPGTDATPPVAPIFACADTQIPHLLRRAAEGSLLNESEIAVLFSARGGDVDLICDAADALRRQVCGDTVGYVVNRNINYTNICTYHCNFCAFSKGRGHSSLRGKAYDLSLSEVARRAQEAWDRGATEVCMQGGINPDYTGETYLNLLRAVKETVPAMHVHAFSPLEVQQGAATLCLPVHSFLERLRDAGLGSLPGTAAEILDDEVRRVICPDKLNTQQWLDVVAAAHEVGLRTTATIMFGHVDHPRHWARHLVRIRKLQAQAGGFTEFVPLPFVFMEAPIGLQGRARRGPTWREVRLMHAVARLSLHPLIPHIQASWAKLGEDGVKAMLRSGADDLGGTLMNESISRAAGAQHGQELPPEGMDRIISEIERIPVQRTTLYREVDPEQHRKSFGADPLKEAEQTPYVRRRAPRLAVA